MSDLRKSPKMKSLPSENSIRGYIESAFGKKPKNLTVHRLDSGKGYMSFILRVKLEWDQGSSLPRDVICKFPTSSKADEQFYEHLDLNDPDHVEIMERTKSELKTTLINCHKNECTALKFFTSHNLPIRAPTYYYHEPVDFATGHGILIAKCLADTASTDPIIEPLAMSKIYDVIDEIATLHAYCYTHADWLSVAGEFPQAVFRSFQDYVNTKLQEIKGLFPAFEYNKKQMESLLSEEWFEDQVAFKENPLRVWVHGDMWYYNIMFDKETSSLAAIIDWQISHCGSPTADMALFLMSCLDAEVWRNELDLILARYYAGLEEKMKPTPPPLSLAELKSQLKTDLPANALAVAGRAFTFLTTILVDEPLEKRQKYLKRISFYIGEALGCV